MRKALAGVSVLLVDDEPDNSELLGLYVESQGASVRIASSAREALELVSSWKPDIMLLDISMPEMDGYDLLKAIRRDPALRSTPAVAVTAHAFERDKRLAAQATFSAHVSKPYDCEALLYIVEKLTVAKPSDEDPPAIRDFRAVLDAQGMHQALGFLNRRTSHRFTGIFRFEGKLLHGLHLFDREHAAPLQGSDAPLRQTFSAIVEAERQPFVVWDSHLDPKLVEHPARDRERAYCGVLLRRNNGLPFGTLCHFDPSPLSPSPDVLGLLLLVAPLVSSAVAVPD
jgi:CheY-like chemotaxis protein